MFTVEVEKQLQGNSTPQLSHKKSHGNSSNIMGTSSESNGNQFCCFIFNSNKQLFNFQKQLHLSNVIYPHLEVQLSKVVLFNYAVKPINVEKQHQLLLNAQGSFNYKYK